MCAQYGLGGGPYVEPPDTPIPPLDERESAERVAEWAAQRDGTARITGKHARNLNPLIREVDGQRRLDLAWWWLWRGDAPARFSAFNSRDDALLRSWRTPFQHRALVPASWYLEKGVRLDLGGAMFGIAAITSASHDANGEEILSYSLVTRRAVGPALDAHSGDGEPRMPLILPAEMHDDWLDPERPGDRELIDRAVLASAGISQDLRRS